MAIDNVPAVQSVLEQVNLLERAFNSPLEANLAYSRMADRYVFPNGIGETITKTRPGLYPLTAAMTPIVPSSNTNTLDNGLSDTFWKSEQFQLAINEYALTTSVNIKQDRTLIERVFLQNVVHLGENAFRTVDGLCAQNLHKAYDAGNTFATAAATGSYTTVHVDNIYGFDTAFSATNSPGLPTPVSGSNVVNVTIVNGANGVARGSAVVTGVSADGSNTSTAVDAAGIAYGASGTLTFQSTPGFNIVAGDQIIASDGAFVWRVGGALTRYQMAASGSLSLEDLANAKAQLEARAIPKLPNGAYLAIIDPKLWPQLLNDVAFQRSSMGQLGEAGSYFGNGMLNRTLGIEFIPSQMAPRFSTGTAGVYARHCMIVGAGALIKGTFAGHLDAAAQARSMNNADIRLMSNDVEMITRAPVDRLQEWVTQTWSWIGGFCAPTDVTSNASIIPTTDAARYKRAVVIEAPTSN